jgi:UPF0755 protein
MKIKKSTALTEAKATNRLSVGIKWLLRLFYLLLSVTVVLSTYFVWYAHTPLKGTYPRELAIPAGASVRGVANVLQRAQVLPSTWQFVWLARVTGHANHLKAGRYLLSSAPTPYQLVLRLTQGDVDAGSLVLPEGWTWQKFQQRLHKTALLKRDTLTLNDAAILAKIGAKEKSLEGLFFPDTYFFDRNSSDIVLLRRAYQIQQQRLNAVWQERDADLPYATPYEALTMASIIEKETALDADRAMVAAVFVNRLKQKMRLQTDPTVIYGLGKRFDGNLRKIDLQTDTPYNTYTRNGLPPSPIAFPSAASLWAALHPADSKALYFVAKGDGSSQFSSSLEEHNKAVNQYQRNH